MRPPDRQQKIAAATTIVMTFFVVNVVFYYFNGLFEGLPFPLNTFLPAPPNRFGDFHTAWDEWNRLHFGGVGFGLTYFPATYLFVDALTWFATPQRALVVFETVFLAFIFIHTLAALRTGDRWQDWRNAVVLTFMSYPVLFTWHTGNLEAILFALLLLHVHAFRRGWFAWSAVPLGIAVAMKLFPLVFIVLYVMHRRYREGLLVFVTAAIATIVPLLVFPGGILDGGLAPYLENLRKSQQLYQDLMVIGPAGVHFGHSLINGTRALLADRFPPMDLLLKPYLVFALGTFLLVSMVMVRTRPPLWKAVTLLVIAMCVLPFTSTDYKLLHLYIPFYLFLNEPREEGSAWVDWTFLWLFALLLVPKSFTYFHGLPLLTLNVVLNPLLMVLLAAAVLTLPSPWLRDRLNRFGGALVFTGGKLARRIRGAAPALVAGAVTITLCAWFVQEVREGPPRRQDWQAAAFKGPDGPPIDAGELPAWKHVSALDLEFEARASTPAYPNFFQTADGTNALRMELVEGGKLYVAVTDLQYLLAAKDFAFDRWHRYRLRIVKDESVQLWIDGALVRTWTGAPAAQEIAMDRLLVGTGFSRQRNFLGEIRNFRLHLDYRWLAVWLRWLLGAAALLALAGTLRYGVRKLRVRRETKARAVAAA